MLLRNAMCLLLLVSSGMHASDALAGLMKKRAEQAMQRHLAQRERSKRQENARNRQKKSTRNTKTV